jgi:hypothetical protein
MLARTAEGAERAQLWELIVRRYPVCASYQGRTSRVIPIVVLMPILDEPTGNATTFPEGTSPTSVRSPTPAGGLL